MRQPVADDEMQGNLDGQSAPVEEFGARFLRLPSNRFLAARLAKAARFQHIRVGAAITPLRLDTWCSSERERDALANAVDRSRQNDKARQCRALWCTMAVSRYLIRRNVIGYR